jgi:hypothetical protein
VFGFRKARRDIKEFLTNKIKIHPYYQVEYNMGVPGIDLPVKQLGVQMLDFINKIMNDLLHYLKIK